MTGIPVVTFIFLSEGFYKDASMLASEINKLKPNPFKDRSNLDSIFKKMRIILYEGETIILHKILSKLLGFLGTN